MPLTELLGTERTLIPGGTVLGPANPNKRIRVTLSINSSRSQGTQRLAEAVAEVVGQNVGSRTHLSRAQYATQFGATPADLDRGKQFATEYGLRVMSDRLVQNTSASQQGHQTIEIEGTIGKLSKAFGVRLLRVRGPDGRVFRSYAGTLKIPDGYSEVIRNVFGLDTRPQAKPRFRTLKGFGGFNPRDTGTAYAPDEIAKLYDFPRDLSGSGQKVALIELGGGFRRRDLKAYFRELGIEPPKVSIVSVAGARNVPDGDPNGADGEVMLDIEVLGAIASKAEVVVYFAPNTSRGFFRAINTAIHDDKNKPSIISISWGGPESTWALRDMQVINDVCSAAAVMGISIFCAAGDAGSTDGLEGTLAHVDFPASSPYVTACGGTRIAVDQVGGSIAAETVWNDAPNSGTGGGVSDVFSVPVYQTGPSIRVPMSVNAGHNSGRGVPDVAGNADPATGYKILVDGVQQVCGGTSAVAPLWAALFALINEGLGRSVGFVNTLLYSVIASTPGALRDIVAGDNDTTKQVGGYAAGVGWDACTGLGSPASGALILNLLRAAN